jgi:transcriptional antiterminator RfaH
MIDTHARNHCRWYVLQAKPRQDARAESNLLRWDVQTFAPKVREARCLPGGDTVYHTVPLFPSYLFARFDAESLAGKIRHTRGIQRIIGFGEYATPVEDAIVQLIQEQMADDGVVRAPAARPGDAVEIIDGPFRSFVGIFERHMCARERVVILLTTIGCHQRVEVAEAAIRKMTRSVA